MPYTPPAQRSPAVSGTNSPNLSRRSSYQPGQQTRPTSSSSRPDLLPRSSSYLTRHHRRTPSVKTVFEPTPPSTADNEKHGLKLSGSLRQSPPPKTDESQVPVGAVISPPDSAQNSSDDEEPGSRGRKLENLAELQAAIRVIEQHRESSPNRISEEVGRAEEAIAVALQPPNNDSVTQRVEEVKAAISQAPRKIAHHRSSTETVFLDLRNSPEYSTTPSDEDSVSDEDGIGRVRPPMLRKKSGELVRPALRPSSARRRPSSMPGTPTFGKAVHFDAHLEHVRHFLQVDRPLAVSAGSSPVEAYESDTEFPFHEEPRGPPFDWELELANFPSDTPYRIAQPVRVERVYLSADNKTLVGSVIVANVSFHKLVVARFTLDYWKTTSEVVAEYNNDVRQPNKAEGHDRFNFSIKLADLANLEAKTMFFCVKYCVNGQEFWDNNGSTNFQVDFRKQHRPQNGKKGSQKNGALPRSHKKSPQQRPMSMPAAFDDFAEGFDLRDFKQPVQNLMGEPGPALRLKGIKSVVNIPSRAPQPAGQAFGNRYDFGASLSAAMNAANGVLGERSGIVLKPKPKPSAMKTPPKFLPDAEDTTSPLTLKNPQNFMSAPPNSLSNPATNSPKPLGAEKPALASQSYNELLDKYCFFRTGKSSPQIKEGTLKSGQYDGSCDSYVLGSVESSNNSSPITMASVDRNPPRTQPPPQTSQSSSPAPMTGFVTGTSPMYPYQRSEFPWYDAHTATAIQG